jgi:putative DNA primase/helicase
MEFYLSQIKANELDLVILDNFSTLGEVEDENAASSFNAIQDFLLRLKTAGVATMLIHHAGKSGDFRGSSKLAATFETIIRLERPAVDAGRGEARFRVVWDKVRSGGPGRHVREAVATLDSVTAPTGGLKTSWTYEAGNLGRLDELRLRLEAGEFAFQTEAADLFGISKMQVSKDIKRGIQLGMFTDFEVRKWLGKGKAMRAKGKTEAPAPLADLEFEAEVEAPF